ncbi:hypothetical protein ACFLTV_00685 [Chloroflexota bacterium]
MKCCALRGSSGCLKGLTEIDESLAIGRTDIGQQERAQLLLHSRAGLGLLLLAKSKVQFDRANLNAECYIEGLFYKERAISHLHKMATTQLSFKDFVARSGPNIVEYSTDMGKLKTTTLLNLFPFLLIGETQWICLDR